MLVPILLPIAASHYGNASYQFGIILSLNLVLGLLTPPLGTGLYIAANAAEVSPGIVFRAVLPFLLAAVAILVFLSWWPRPIMLAL